MSKYVGLWTTIEEQFEEIKLGKRVNTIPPEVRAKESEERRLLAEQRRYLEERGATLKSGSKDAIHALMARRERECWYQSHNGVDAKVHQQRVVQRHTEVRTAPQQLVPTHTVDNRSLVAKIVAKHSKLKGSK